MLATNRSFAGQQALDKKAVRSGSNANVAPSLIHVRLSLNNRKFVLSSRQSIKTNSLSDHWVNPEVEKTKRPLDVVFVTAEVAPWSKTGGLGDVAGGLPIELAKRGHRVITVAPRYDQYHDAWDTSVVLDIDGEKVRFFHAAVDGVDRVFVDHPLFLSKVWGKTGSKLYGSRSGADYRDNHLRFKLLSKAAIEATRVLPFGHGEESVFIVNDWHTALVPVYLKHLYRPKGEFLKAKTALCIHNIAFQGRMFASTFTDLGLPAAALEDFTFADGYPRVFTEDSPGDEEGEDEEAFVEAPGKLFKKINWLKGGIRTADKVLTVSPNYAKEITADESRGVELDTFLRASGIEGIVNGMDVTEWNPKTDKYLSLPYDQSNVLLGKLAAKQALQAELGLPVDAAAPLFGFIGRLEQQKGVDVLLAALPKILEQTPNAQVIILGTGKASLEKKLKAVNLAQIGGGRAKGVVAFSAPLAHLITAGADFMLVPSRFEPCGLIQLHAMQYGTVPVVASTGGLVDTVKEGVTGFHIGEIDPKDVLEEDVDNIASTCTRAAVAFATPGKFKELVYNCISQDLSWALPAKKWEGVLEELKFGAPAGAEKKKSVKIPVEQKFPAPISGVQRAPGKVSEAAKQGIPVRTPVPINLPASAGLKLAVAATAPAKATAGAASTSPVGAAPAVAAATPARPTPAAATPAVAAAAPIAIASGPLGAKPAAAPVAAAPAASNGSAAAASNGAAPLIGASSGNGVVPKTVKKAASAKALVDPNSPTIPILKKTKKEAAEEATNKAEEKRTATNTIEELTPASVVASSKKA